MSNLNDGLFWAAREINGKVEFFRSTTYTKNAEIYQDFHIPQKFLKIENNEVVVLSADQQQQILDNEAVQQEAERLRLEQLAIDAEQQNLIQQEILETNRKNEFLAMASMINSYVTTLRKYFGENAETDQNITEQTVTEFFEMKRLSETITPVENADLLALLRYFTILATWNGTGETWTLPYHLLNSEPT